MNETVNSASDARTANNVMRHQPADGPRYKALGNSMAVNVMRWLGQRIQQVENLSEAA